ncbi:nucleotidyltransferase family protein [Sinomonas sp. JGH33]|uniref:Nucleotidyltransferase family protein n=1 Tax=Sinomonas terricola TaxID=3110330 RepID=A0ABU5TBW7_9MICC|nr:nucleotidyltransferase family protein [Sinomonas sp. JGH33]MEA5457187.1 nucleotidyltransferase family protein [Sinomonas sp. JGH33]
MRADLSAPVAGILLAAGAGVRFGGPKALAASPETGSWLRRGVDLLLAAGCEPVVVVLGASATEARALLPDDPRVMPVIAADWAEGIGASLRAALDVLGGQGAPLAALVTLVDLPKLNGEALARVALGAVGPESLRRAVYDGAPGHPVLIGRAHWAPLRSVLAGDVGAGPYLRAHGAEPIDCTGLGGNEDVDRQSGSNR